MAFSVGASGTLLSQAEGAAAADAPANSFLLAAALPQAGHSANGSASQSAVYHTVQAGDSLWQIAQAHQVDVQSIKSANGISPDEVIKVGQVLRVPANARPDTSLSETAVSVPIPAAQPVSELVALASPKDQASESETETLAASLSEVQPVKGEWAEADAVQSIASASRVEPQVEVKEQASTLQVEAEDQASTLQAAASTPQSGIPSTSSQTLEPSPEGAWVTRSFESTQDSDAITSSVQDSAAIASSATTTEAATPVEAAPIESTESTLPAAPIEVKKSQQIAALSERVEGTSTAQPLVPVVPAAETYRVKPGDTLWTISSRYGLRPEALVQANAVRDPNLIVAGDVIEIPQQLASADLTAVPSIAPVSSGSVAERIARIREAGDSSVNRAELYERIRQARQSLEEREAPVAAAEPSILRQASAAELPSSLPLNDNAASGQADPHVSSLIADIRAMQRQRTVAIVPSSEASTVSAVEEPTQVAVAPASLNRSNSQAVEIEPANPEFSPAPSERATPAPDLLAAAPLGPEAYAPTMNVPTGRTVSPDMPILPEPSEYLPEAPARFNGYMWPAQGVLTSGYGQRWGRMHQGVDIAGPVGTPIYAAATGTVERSGWNSGGYGNLVDIRHPDGSMTRYAHNSRLLVRPGQAVRQGQQIAEMGSTGYSTGPHLHFEVHLPGNGAVNPVAYLPGR
ncbi:MAG: peptidoglycan DD-metalloendopeptidase family protein [Cyanobacteria bacterium Co-bin8]|nr:peptidoglycan DD-metalloendopeptidase family protein [Cyanobacteria bacterium Co-bin8]